MLKRALISSFVLFLGVSQCFAESMPIAVQQDKNNEASHFKIPYSKAWLKDAQQRIAIQEYHFHFGPSGKDNSVEKKWQAPNRKHGLRIFADEQGITVIQRQGARKHLFDLKTVQFGRNDTKSPLKPGVISVNENLITIQRENLTEWFDNSPDGLEHGYTIDIRPHGTGLLSLVLDCSSRPVLLNKTHLVLGSESGYPLEYSKLLVTDATSRKLDAKLALVENNRFSIDIDDTNATYPITVDPIITSSFDALLIGTQERGTLGYSVASAGDVNGDGYTDVIIGSHDYDSSSYNSAGAVFLHLGGSNGIDLTPVTFFEGNSAYFYFGTSLSGAGDINGDGYDDFIIGSDPTSISDPGSAYIYYGSSTPASGLVGITLTGSNGGDNFGQSVSGAGDINGDGYADVIIGIPKYDRGVSTDEGRAFVYYGSAAGLQLSTPDDFGFPIAGQIIISYPYACFGSTVSDGGDINRDGYADILVATSPDPSTASKVFIYYGSSSGISDDVIMSDEISSPQLDSGFGRGLARAGDANGDGYGDIVIGAPTFDADGLLDQGAVFFHFGSSTGLSSTITPLAFKSNQAGAFLGISVSSASDINADGYGDIIAGAHGYNSYMGAVFIYHGNGGDGVHLSRTIAPTVFGNSRFGYSVAGLADINNDGFGDIFSGAYLLDYSTLKFVGGVFVYHGSASTINSFPDAFLESNQAGAYFGTSISSAGDFNGDGFDDIIIGASSFDKGMGTRGMSFLYFGPPGGFLWPFPLQLGGDVTYADYFGSSVSRAGDVNGDGFSDVIIGAHNGTGPGSAFVYYGDAFFNFLPKTELTESGNIYFGIEVSGAGDVNGDGYSDVIVSDPNYNSNKGRVSVFHGSASGIISTSKIRIEEKNAGNLFGLRVSNAGDINGDGYADIAVGSPNFSNGESGEGAVYIYHGSKTGLPLKSTTLLQSNSINAGLGNVTNAGDVNGDDYGDIFVGASHYSNGETLEGAGFLYPGSFDGVSDSSRMIVEGNQANSRYGHSISGAGDVNGDGYDDVILGSYANSVKLFYGRASGVDLTSPVEFTSPQPDSSFGRTVSEAGDVNGDGFADILIGAMEYDNGQANEGMAFIYLGNNNGRQHRFSALRKDGTRLVVPGSFSHSNQGFQVRMDLHSPLGKERMRMETLVCPAVMPPPGIFNLCDYFISPWQDGGLNYSYAIDGLSPGLYTVQSRIGYTPYFSIIPGSTITNPRHGPWRYLSASPSQSTVRIGTGGFFFWPMFLPAILNNK